jgi:hypothetical protein
VTAHGVAACDGALAGLAGPRLRVAAAVAVPMPCLLLRH